MLAGKPPVFSGADLRESYNPDLLIISAEVWQKFAWVCTATIVFIRLFWYWPKKDRCFAKENPFQLRQYHVK